MPKLLISTSSFDVKSNQVLQSLQDQGFEIPKDAVLFTAEPMEDLANEYNSAFGSGLVVPSKEMAVPSLKLTT